MSDLESVLRALVREEVARALAARTQQPDDYLSPRAAGELAGVGPATVRRWIRAGRLERCGIGARILVRRSDLDRLLRSGALAEPSTETPAQMARRLLRSVG